MVADGGTIARAVYVILEDDVADKEVCARFVGADFLSDGEYDAIHVARRGWLFVRCE